MVVRCDVLIVGVEVCVQTQLHLIDRELGDYLRSANHKLCLRKQPTWRSTQHNHQHDEELLISSKPKAF